MKKASTTIFVGHLIFFGLIIAGFIPRGWILPEVAVVAVYLLAAPLEEGLVFFVRSIPLFIAIPLTSNFDNFNMWRIFSVILFLKWFFLPQTLALLKAEASNFFKKPLNFIREHKVLFTFKFLAILAILSLWHAPDKVDGLKRIIYFVNAGLIGAVIYYHGNRNREFISRLIRNITIPAIIVTVVGVLQVVSTYLMDIYQFMALWGEGVELRLFGAQWSYIAVRLGNTWFAYFGNQLSLRVFSLFPDSHSFPIFLLLALPAFFAWTLRRPLAKQGDGMRAMASTRATLNVLWIPLVFLMMILSGTRGIWAGAIAIVIWAVAVLFFLHRRRVQKSRIRVFGYLSCYLVIFFLLFAVAYPIFASPQFLVSKADSLLLQKRFASIIDFGETSNSQRLTIWRASGESILRHPALGVGIGNFPVVLNQDVRLAKAGSSAHNVYLQIAAEMGIFSLLVALYFIWLMLKAIYAKFVVAEEPFRQAYFGGLLITIPWILAYLMTDVALFDERALLLFAITLGIVFSDE